MIYLDKYSKNEVDKLKDFSNKNKTQAQQLT